MKDLESIEVMFLLLTYTRKNNTVNTHHYNLSFSGVIIYRYSSNREILILCQTLTSFSYKK